MDNLLIMPLQSTIIQQANLEENDQSQFPRADFNQDFFDKLIYEKGRRVLYETAVVCPCKSKAVNQQANCKNCGGTGYAFINPIETRIVLQGVEIVTKLEGWSEQLQGMMRISCPANLDLTHMDKITALDGDDWYNEALPVELYGSTLFTYATYPIKKIKHIGLFTSVNTKYQWLQPSDYSVDKSAITILNTYGHDINDIMITIKYKYAPIFYVRELKRSTMETFKYVDGIGEKVQHMPLSAYAQRAHYVLNQPNLAGDRLLDNSYPIDTCSTGGCCQ